jgi:hypothetical protein
MALCGFAGLKFLSKGKYIFREKFGKTISPAEICTSSLFTENMQLQSFTENM